jgi:energy-coupling factor transporter ATP-binding protein EcfA2
VIDIKNISVEYKSGKTVIPALRSISLNISKGDYLAVLGPNGSGKSTLVKALCGLIPCSAGEIEINGFMVTPGGFPERLFGKMGVVFQEPSGQFLMPTVIKELESALQNLGLSYPQQRKRLDDIIPRRGVRKCYIHLAAELRLTDCRAIRSE